MSSSLDHASALPLIQPPPELRDVINSTAEFIRQKGIQVEEQLRERKLHDMRFGFLQSSNPYYVYYRRRVEFGEEVDLSVESGIAVAPEVVAAPVVVVASNVMIDGQVVSDTRPVRSTLTQRLRGIIDRHTPKLPETHTEELPPKVDETLTTREFSVFPVRVRDMDLDVIRETALYSSCNHGRFIGNLLNFRYNDLFPFVHPTHPLFGLYKQYVEAYSKITNVSMETKSSIKSDIADNLESLFSKLVVSAQYQHKEELVAIHEAMQQAQEQALTRQVDWANFKLVDKVLFDSQEDGSLPDPLGSIQAIDEFVRMQEVVLTERLAYELTVAAGVDQGDTSHDAAAYEPLALESMLEQGLEIRSMDSVKMVNSAKKEVALLTCPVCTQSVPAADQHEHMRIELLDPQWRAQKKALEQRHQLSGSVTGADVAQNVLGGSYTAPVHNTNTGNVGPVVDNVGMKRKLDQFYQQQQEAIQQQQQQLLNSSLMHNTNLEEQQPVVKRAKLLDVHKQSILESQLLPAPVFDTSLLPAPVAEPVPTNAPAIASGGALISEDLWAQQHTGSILCHVKVPQEDNSQHNFNGQTLFIELASVKATVLDLKQAISAQLNNLPPNKMKVCVKDGNFLNKDTSTLAAYNISTMTFFEVGHRVRGGKKV